MFNEGLLPKLVRGAILDVPNASKTIPIKLENSRFTKDVANPPNVIVLLNSGEHDREPI